MSTVHLLFLHRYRHHRDLHSFPTRRSSDLDETVGKSLKGEARKNYTALVAELKQFADLDPGEPPLGIGMRSEEHTSELQSRRDLVCRLLLEKKKKKPVRPKGRRQLSKGSHR